MPSGGLCYGKTHCAVLGIALDPTVTATIKAGAWSRIRCEIAIPASLKPRKPRAFASQDAYMHAPPTREPEERCGPKFVQKSNCPGRQTERKCTGAIPTYIHKEKPIYEKVRSIKLL
jgi:hypothetical protein